jgi:ketosteroid isomerase-like protein
MRGERIDVFGDFALVRAVNRHALIQGGKEVVGMSAYTDVYVREGGRWLCVQAQITAVAPENYPNDDTIVCRYLQGILQAPSL